MAGVLQAQPAAVDQQRLLNADADVGNWLTYGRTYQEQRFSPLDQINDENIDQLGLAWSLELPTNQNVESTPLAIDGVLYLTLPWSRVVAVDGATGEQLWLYDPEVPGEWNINVCCGFDNRGAAAYEGKIIFGTLDGRLIALDAGTGQPVWSIQATPEGRYSITGAPRVADGKVFIGSAGGEFDVRGHIDAYDVNTGERLWRFFTVPGNPADGFEDDTQAMIAETWIEEGWWDKGPGGTVWDAITYDPQTDLVIFGTGNGAPWDAVDRDAGQGDNLFLSSIVAVHADDGTYAWHYQETPWETWDYDTGQQLMLLDMEVDGQMRHVVTQASKNGFFYVLDAATGEFLSGENYTEVNWATGINKETGRPFIVPEARYNITGAVYNLVPGPAGGHAWQPMSYSPNTGLVYIPATTHWTLVGDFDARAEHLKENPNARQSFTGRLVAWDPVNQREVWRGEEQINPRGGVQVIGGALTTAGNIVFNGNLPNQEFVAYRATDGERLWSFDTKTAVFPGAISYLVDGEQYIAIAVGGPVQGGYYAPNGARLLVFKLGGEDSIPDLPAFTQRPIAPPEQFASAEVISAGGRAFEANCATCHAHGVGRGRSSFPDLRRTPALHSQELFDNIVLGGQLSANGMVSFSEYIDAGDTEAIRAYIVSLAEKALEE
ncbi:MAG: PQQ-dependent dehydrogenase, methanol/ethanol family [Gammaproteobacteria bacterium]|nr:PQQ-dependent dehydrogenase, methanol/ethanol family [Gammaproteobacteria bacterium]